MLCGVILLSSALLGAPLQASQTAETPDAPTPLFAAIERRDAAEVRRTIDAGVDVNAPDADGITPLMRAAAGGDAAVLQILLGAKGVDIKARATSGDTALSYAVLYKHADAVKLLVAKGALMNAADSDGYTPMMLAAEQGTAEMVQAMIDAGASIGAEADGRTPLMAAAAANRLETIRLLIARGANVNAKSRDGATALMAAAYGGHAEAIRLLVAGRADLTSTDMQGRSPLMATALSGSPDAVSVLLASHADVAVADANGATALYYAIGGGYLEIGEMLVKAGARAGRDELMRTAAARGNTALVKSMMAQGVSVDAKSPGDGVTALIEACFADAASMVEFLVAQGAKVNTADEEGRTPLMGAAASGNAALVKLLLSKGAVVDVTDKTGRTPWNHAMRNGHAEVAQLLAGSSD